jgi:DoxX-like family
MTILTIITTILTAAIFLAAARVKFNEEEHAMDTRDRLAIQPTAYRVIGICEVGGAVGALLGLASALRPLGIVSLTGLVLLALGACAAHVKLNDPVAQARPAVLALLLSCAALVLQIATA